MHMHMHTHTHMHLHMHMHMHMHTHMHTHTHMHVIRFPQASEPSAPERRRQAGRTRTWGRTLGLRP